MPRQTQCNRWWEACGEKSAPDALPSLEQGLLEILRLCEAGESKAAYEKLLVLHKRFPKEDLPARLEALRKR
ncbi:hypothetical protein [Pseudomonas sp. Pdm06]|uniref:hypothetical protein n=1 Tax=Pseudomonas sp. Pdm06 TaxID=1790044 RepID=UPI00177CA4EF|nr:hypothetical protein [Pseudomonas sp. Pdm06]MBD9467278.1 hypothetical protein [Pseudomonas sp. Pdm06]